MLKVYMTFEKCALSAYFVKQFLHRNDHQRALEKTGWPVSSFNDHIRLTMDVISKIIYMWNWIYDAGKNAHGFDYFREKVYY